MGAATENRLRIARARAVPTPLPGGEPALTCVHGHVLEGANLGTRPNGRRYCRRCEIERGRERRRS